MENLYIAHGKTNKYNVPAITLEMDNNNNTYRFFYMGLHDIMIECLRLIAESKKRLLSMQENEQLCNAFWIVSHKDTDKQNSKLAGIKSISTSCKDNKFCLARMKNPNSICSHCYADSQQSVQFALAEHNIINGIILRNVVLPIESIRKALAKHFLLEKYARIESFGDVDSVTQCINYIHIMKAFPDTTFAVWTKNYMVWYKAFKQEGKPNNCVFIVSSDKVNVRLLVPLFLRGYVDHVFTVYTKEFAEQNNITINCGGRKCMECILAKRNCYFHGTLYFINELLK